MRDPIILQRASRSSIEETQGVVGKRIRTVTRGLSGGSASGESGNGEEAIGFMAVDPLVMMKIGGES